MRNFLFTTLAGLALSLSSWTQAFTPESGFWIAPSENGRGYTIEIQDNYLFLAFYVYDSAGRATWYTAQGTMQGNARFVGVLDGFINGQCLTCVNPVNPSVQLGVGGSIELLFDAETRGRLILGGRTIALERFNFGLAIGTSNLRSGSMLGEWQSTLDYSAVPNADSRYYGDVFVFNSLRSSGGLVYFEGCRPDNTANGACSSTALSQRDASGFYDANSGRYFVVVGNTSTSIAVYTLTIGTYQFDGTMKVCPRGLSSISNQCLNNGVYSTQPVRGFRTASKTFVLTGSGPSAVEPTPKAATERALPLIELAGASKAVVDQNLPVDTLDALARRFK